MQWALLNTEQRVLKTGHWENGDWVDDFIDSPPGTIFNFIMYDGVSPYTPPSGFVLAEVDDSARLGDFIGLE
jgi:hypothetical protein